MSSKRDLRHSDQRSANEHLRPYCRKKLVRKPLAECHFARSLDDPIASALHA